MIKTENNLYCVYVHRNTINNKRYVGITSKSNPKDRWGRAGNGYYNNRHFYASIKKYGWNAFEHIIIADKITVDEACSLEQELIAKYQSNNPLYGYNICSGGETNILPQESLDKISKKNKGRIMSEEAKRKRAKNPPKAISVICDGKEFISITECAKYYSINPKEMEKWLCGRGYVSKFFVDKQLRPKGVEVEYQENPTKRQWVFCDDKEYPSVCEFCRQEGISVDTVNGWLYGKYKMRTDYVQRGLKREPKILYKIIIKEIFYYG